MAAQIVLDTGAEAVDALAAIGLDIIGLDGGGETSDQLVLISSWEGGEEGVIIKLNGFEVGLTVAPVVSLLCCGSFGDCIKGGKLCSQVIILEMVSGSSGQILTLSWICSRIKERNRLSNCVLDKWRSQDKASATSLELPLNHWL